MLPYDCSVDSTTEVFSGVSLMWCMMNLALSPGIYS